MQVSLPGGGVAGVLRPGRPRPALRAALRQLRLRAAVGGRGAAAGGGPHGPPLLRHGHQEVRHQVSNTLIVFSNFDIDVNCQTNCDTNVTFF